LITREMEGVMPKRTSTCMGVWYKAPILKNCGSPGARKGRKGEGRRGRQSKWIRGEELWSAFYNLVRGKTPRR